MKVRGNKEQKFIVVDIDELEINSILSYSRIECFEKCNYKYKLKYVDKNYSDDSAIALDVGTLCHYIMEMKYKGMSNEELLNIFQNGYLDTEVTVKGINKIEDEYGFDFYEKNEKTGISYEDKLNSFKERFLNESIDEDWETIGTEKEFQILFNDKAVIKGFIDRVDRHKETGAIRVVDYKTNSKPFEKSFLSVPLQMYIYGLACYELYGEYPTEYIYDMLFLNIKQIGGTCKTFLQNGFKKLNNRIDSISWFNEIGADHMKPKPSPLCYFCEFCGNNPNVQDKYKELCQYYSLWQPNNRVFKTNKEWVAPITESGW